MMKTAKTGRILALMLALLPQLGSRNAHSETISGTIVAVLDADTVSVSQAKDSEVWVRLADIDLPENLQAFGEEARQALSDKVLGQTVTVDVSREDPFGRLIGHIYIDDRWINDELVREGYAWHYKEFSNDKRLAGAETIARERAEKLWARPEPMAPWLFRQRQKHQMLMTIDAFLDKRTRIPDPYDMIQQATVVDVPGIEEELASPGDDSTIAVPAGWLSRPRPTATATKATTTRAIKKTTTKPVKKAATRSRTTYGSGSK